MSSSLTKGLRRSTSRSKVKPAAKSAKRVVKTKSASKPKARRAAAAKPVARKALKTAAAKKTAAKSKSAVKARKPAAKPAARKAAPKKAAPVSRVKTTQKQAAVRAVRPAPTPPPPRPPTQDESAALVAFERAHKEFARGRFAEARNQFRVLVDKYSQVAEVAARARTYLTIAESRLRTESILPRDADSLYDRGVIELNRGEYVAAQEMFERALKREPEAAHIHYGLAATRARLGSIDLALESLQKALDLQPNLRVRAQHDHDLNPLRNDPDFDRLIFSHAS
ncbi:MAG TPA: tetratricopeptide repeat protein [Pyrinomonadaceae bacterium]|jgi:tetratricopeptide (TPR) repeat protein|nr:tetratricopeptide repeat protein [Pyrinomonadaceae bacterium]